MRIWLVGGGTAGHVSPLLSVATELESRLNTATRPGDIRLVIDRSPTARRILAAAPKRTTHRLVCGKLRRYRGQSWLRRLTDIKSWFLNMRDAFLILAGTLQALYLALIERPDVVFLNGGSIGVPVALAVRMIGRPYIVHESDTVMGLANRLVAPAAAKVATAFDINLGSELAAKSQVTGIPLKSQFSDEGPNEENLQHLRDGLQLEGELPIVLAVGGSLGAERLNRWLITQADELLDACHLILISGQANWQAAQALLAANRPVLIERLSLLPFTDRMADLMRLADLVITRAGATTLAEVASIGRAAVIVPNDMLSGGHQSSNAAWFAAGGRAEVLPESALAADPAILVRTVKSLLADEPRRRRLAEAIHKLHVEDSAKRVAELIIEVGERAG